MVIVANGACLGLKLAFTGEIASLRSQRRHFCL